MYTYSFQDKNISLANKVVPCLLENRNVHCKWVCNRLGKGATTGQHKENIDVIELVLMQQETWG